MAAIDQAVRLFVDSATWAVTRGGVGKARNLKVNVIRNEKSADGAGGRIYEYVRDSW